MINWDNNINFILKNEEEFHFLEKIIIEKFDVNELLNDGILFTNNIYYDDFNSFEFEIKKYYEHKSFYNESAINDDLNFQYDKIYIIDIIRENKLKRILKYD